MSVSLYDTALLDKLKYWTEDTDIHIYSTDETKRLFQVVADEHQDQIKLPIISIRRSGYEVINPRMRQLSYNGLPQNFGETSAFILNAIPIKLNYQLDIYTRYAEQAEDLSRNLMFNIINYNKLLIDIPYQGSYIEHRATMRVGTEIQDNSAVPERLVAGQFTRLTMNLDIDDAYLWDVHERTLKSISNGYVEIGQLNND